MMEKRNEKKRKVDDSINPVPGQRSRKCVRHSDRSFRVLLMVFERLQLSFFSSNLRNIYRWQCSIRSRILKGHTGAGICLEMLGDGISLVAGSSSESTLKVWNTITGACHVLQARPVRCLAALGDLSLIHI